MFTEPLMEGTFNGTINGRHPRFPEPLMEGTLNGTTNGRQPRFPEPLMEGTNVFRKATEVVQPYPIFSVRWLLMKVIESQSKLYSYYLRVDILGPIEAPTFAIVVFIKTAQGARKMFPLDAH